jgi:hypothetical protein
MILSENRCPLFGIVLEGSEYPINGPMSSHSARLDQGLGATYR